MPDVIFKQEQQHNTAKTSIQILEQLQDYLNQAERKVLEELVQYHEEKGQWPTCRELCQYSEIQDNTLQPRLTNDLRQKQVVQTAGKRPCNAADHSISVNTWKTTTQVTQ